MTLATGSGDGGSCIGVRERRPFQVDLVLSGRLIGRWNRWPRTHTVLVPVGSVSVGRNTLADSTTAGAAGIVTVAGLADTVANLERASGCVRQQPIRLLCVAVVSWLSRAWWPV